MFAPKIPTLTHSYKNITGKNNTGKIVFNHRGGGVKKLFRSIDFKKKFINVYGLVAELDNDPFRNNSLSLISYDNGVLTYNILIKDLTVGDYVNDFAKNLFVGSTYFLKQLPIGVYISLLELTFNKKLQLVRAPGTKGQILAKSNTLVTVQLPSGLIRKFLNNCKAVYGTVDVNLRKSLPILKAGINRRKNKRPIVRGVAMNPIDHPHGGGQGKTSGGRKMSTSPWSKYTKGLKPKKKKKKLAYIY